MKLSKALAFAAVFLATTIPHVVAFEIVFNVKGSSPVAEITQTADQVEQTVEQTVLATVVDATLAVVEGAVRRHLEWDFAKVEIKDGVWYCLIGPQYDQITCPTPIWFQNVYYTSWTDQCPNSFPDPNLMCNYWDYSFHVDIKEDLQDIIALPPGFDSYPDYVKFAINEAIQDLLPFWKKKEVLYYNEYGLFIAEGDPHIETWGGNWYDYMGACDLKLIHAPHFDGDTALDINIRTKIRYDYSYIESAVLKLGNDTLEVASFGEYVLNGVHAAGMPNFVGGYPVTHEVPSKKINIFKIHVGDKETIVMKSFKDMVAVTIKDADFRRYHDSLGMIGSFDQGGKMIARDGQTVIEDPDAFADEWQIRQDEPMLFTVANGPQHPEKCQLPNPAKAKGRRLGETIVLEAAEKACAKYAAKNQEACVHDVIAIGDLDLAAAGAF